MPTKRLPNECGSVKEFERWLINDCVCPFARMAGVVTTSDTIADARQLLRDAIRERRPYLALVFDFDPPLTQYDYDLWMWHTLDKISPNTSPKDRPDYAFTFEGEKLFVIGCHPNADRPERRSPVTAIVFTRHADFQHLRKTNVFYHFCTYIREKTRRVFGSVSPLLAHYGERSEAEQYAATVPPDA